MAALHVHDEHLKSLREMLCAMQVSYRDNPYRLSLIDELCGEIDRHRPIGPDGKHGDRHTDTCGCEDK
jgi:hypothetical protein